MIARPEIDEGNPPGIALLWQHLVSPTPGRLENTIRATVLVLAVVGISEIFRIPEIALSAYVVLFVSKSETASTVLTALMGALAVILALLVCIVVFMASLSQPALRVPLIAVMTFVAMFLARTGGMLGPAFFVFGFIVAYGLTLGDITLGLAVEPSSAANTLDFTLPALAFMPREEALVHFLLWIGLVAAIPAGLVIFANLVTGRDPAILLRAALNDRLLAAARFCDGQPGAEQQLERLVREGTADLLKLRQSAALLHRSPQPAAPVTEIHALMLRLLAVPRFMGDRTGLIPVASFCREMAGTGHPPPTVPVIVLQGLARPLGVQISSALRSIAEPGQSVAASGPKVLLVPDAFSNPEYTRFALKVTLAVMITYAVMDLCDWYGIHTCVITCFFVGLGTVGQTMHKATLRFTGCMIGAGLGIGSILVLMPSLTDLGHLLLLLLPVTFAAAWIGFGSERISYAGLQLGLAFYLAVLQGFGPTLNMEVARDRTVGLLFGDLTTFVIFVTIWPVSVAAVARGHLVSAVRNLAALLRGDGAEAAHLAGFEQPLAEARELMVNDAFEPRAVLAADRRQPIDADILARVQALIVAVSVILDLRREDGSKEPMYERRLAAWLERAAAWIQSGAEASEVAATLPDPPTDVSPAGACCRSLDHDIRGILRRVGAPAATVEPQGRLRFAGG